MTSRKLLFNLVREDIKHRLFVLAINLLTLFFVYPVASALMVSRVRLNAVTNSIDVPTAEYIAEYTFRHLTSDFVDLFGKNGVTSWLAMLAVFTAVTGFAWFAKDRKTDYYHGLPVGRNTLFLAFSLSSFLMTMLPCFVFGLIAAFIAMMGGGDGAVLFATVLGAFVKNIPPVFLCFSTSVLAMVLTGNIVVAVLGNIVFFAWGPSVIGLASVLFSTYFRSFCSEYYGELIFSFVPYSSPMAVAISGMEGRETWAVPYFIIILAVGAAIFVLSLFLYRIRPSEAAGKAMAFARTEAPIKFAIVIPSSLAGAVFLRSIMGSTAWGVFGFVFTLLLTHCVMEIIYHADFRRLFAHKGQLLLCFVISAAILSIFRFDIFGYDRYVPRKDELVSAGIFSSELEGNFDELNQTVKIEEMDYSDEYYLGFEDIRTVYQAVDAMDYSDTDSILRIASQGVEDTAAQRKFDGAYRDALYGDYSLERETGEEGYYGNVNISFHLKNGKTVRRNYQMNMKPVRDDFDALHDSAAFKNAVYPVLSMKGDDLAGINFQDVLGRDHVKLPDHGKQEELLKVYQEELSNLTMDTRRKEDPVLCLQFKSNEFQKLADEIRARKGNFSEMNEVGYYPVYPSFTKTLEKLKECGVDPYPMLSGAGSERIKLNWNGYQEDGDTARPNSAEFTGEKEMDEIIKAAACSGLVYNNTLSNKYFTIMIEVLPNTDAAGRSIAGNDWELEGFDSGIYENCYSMWFFADRVPEFVKEEFAITDEDIKNDVAVTY